jgi:hypothetical protein
MEHMPADPHDHWSVTPDEGGKGTLIEAERELLQQLRVAALFAVQSGGNPADMPDDDVQSCLDHRLASRGSGGSPT